MSDVQRLNLNSCFVWPRDKNAEVQKLVFSLSCQFSFSFLLSFILLMIIIMHYIFFCDFRLPLTHGFSVQDFNIIATAITITILLLLLIIIITTITTIAITFTFFFYSQVWSSDSFDLLSQPIIPSSPLPLLKSWRPARNQMYLETSFPTTEDQLLLDWILRLTLTNHKDRLRWRTLSQNDPVIYLPCHKKA